MSDQFEGLPSRPQALRSWTLTETRGMTFKWLLFWKTDCTNSQQVQSQEIKWSILEIAAQELKFSAEKHLKSYKRRKKPMDSEGDGTKSVVCRHSCTLHMELPNPALWGSLPHEMLQLIFARLSLRDIRSLRCLSKD